MIKGPNVMLGYWNNPEATRAILGADGWLNSGDTARIDPAGHVFITGRLKEIIVLSNGEKLPPADIESAIARDALFEQIMLLGEAKPYLAAIVVLAADPWKKLCAEKGLDPSPSALGGESVEQLLLARVAAQMKEFPGYAQVRRVRATLEPWTVENGLLTPTLKLKRAKVMERFAAEVDRMYVGH
jgi:long-chain acyl-CoA synthetase